MTVLTPANAFPNLAFPQHGGNPNYPVGFNPTSLITGQGGFWRADVGVTQSGGPVTQWNDQSSFANNLTVLGTGTSPTYSATGFFNLPGITFTDVSANDLGSASISAASSTYSVFILMKPNATNGSRYVSIATTAGGSTATPTIITYNVSAGGQLFGVLSTSELGNGGVGINATNGVPILTGFVADGAHVNKWKNAQVVGSASTFSSTLGDATTHFILGSSLAALTVGNNSAGATYAFVGITQKALAQQDWNNLATWANINFGTTFIGGDFTASVQSFTYPGAVWPKATGPAVLSWLNAFPSGAVARARKLKGVNDNNVIIPSALPQLTSTISIAYGYNHVDAPGPSNPNRIVPLYRGDSGLHNINYLVLHTDSAIQLVWTTSANTYVSLSAPYNTFDTGVWHQILISSDYTLGNTSIYQDGASLSVSKSGTLATPSSVGTRCEIGGDDGSDSAKSFLISDLGIWSNQLSSTHASLLASGQRGNQIGQNGTLAAYWQMLGLSPEPDQSGNGFPGTVGSAVVTANGPLNLGSPIYFPQHGSGLTNTVQDFLYPGAVQPQVPAGAFMVFSQQKIIIPILMTVPVTVTVT